MYIKWIRDPTMNQIQIIPMKQIVLKSLKSSLSSDRKLNDVSVHAIS